MDLIDILKSHHINHTSAREQLLQALYNREPLTRQEIIKTASFKLNRITLYRTLREFVNKNVIVRIQDDNGADRYFLNYVDKKDHIHFKCIHCGKLYSFPNQTFNYKSLPKGYIAKEKKLFITGICNKCN